MRWRNVSNELHTDQERPKKFQDNGHFLEYENGGAERHISKWKHIYIRHNYIMSSVEEQQISVIPVPVENIKLQIITLVLLPRNLPRATIAAEIFVWQSIKL